MSFIQVQQSLVTHRKTLRLARLLGVDRFEVVGRLVALWSWCLDNALDGCLGDDIDAEVLADVMGWSEQTGDKGKPAELLDALLTAGFLDLDPVDRHLHIHDWREHMGKLIEKREANAERMRETRARAREEREQQREAGPARRQELAQSAPSADDARATHVRRTFIARATVEKSREERSISTGQEGSVERERAREHEDAARAADAALTLIAPDPPASSTSATPPKVTPLHSARVPDPVWDACIASMGAAPSNRVERGKWAKGIQALKESLAADGSPPTEICVRSARYRARFGTSLPLNPMALAGNWTTLSTDIPVTGQEGRRHGYTGQQRAFAGAHGQFGRSPAGTGSGGRHDGRAGKPQVGTPEYYAQAVAEQYG